MKKRLPGLLTAVIIPALIVVAGLLIAAASVIHGERSTGRVTVHDCPLGTETITLIVEAQPMPPVVEEDPSDNVDESTVTICIVEGE